MSGRLGAGRLGAFRLGGGGGAPGGGTGPFVPSAPRIALTLATTPAGTPLHDPSLTPSAADPLLLRLSAATAGVPNTRVVPQDGLLLALRKDLQRPLLRVLVGGKWQVWKPASLGLDADTVPPFPEMTWGNDLELVAGGDALPIVTVDATSASVDWGIDPAGPRVASCSVTVAAASVAEFFARGNHSFRPYLPIQVQMGYRDDDGFDWWDAVFSGWLTEDEQARWPTTNVLTGQGFLVMAQQPLYKNFAWGKDAKQSGSEQQFVVELLTRAGLAQYSIHGSGEAKIGVKRTVKVAPQAAPLDIIGQLDALVVRFTRDGKYGRIWRRGFPLDADALREHEIAEYADGDPVLPILPFVTLAAGRSVAQPVNRVIALGLKPDEPGKSGDRSYYARRDPSSPWVPTEGLNPLTGKRRILSRVIQSDWLETDSHCKETVYQHMRLENKPRRRYTLVVPGNPFLTPGEVLRVTSATLGLDRERMVIYGVRHDASDGHWQTTCELDAGLGRDGERLSLLPVARISRDSTVEIEPGIWQVEANGAYSSDEDTDYLLTYHWYNSVNGKTLDGEERSHWTLFLTGAELDAAPDLHLIVENTYGLTAHAQREV